MVHNAAEGLRSQSALPDAGVAVLVGAHGVQAVVQVEGLQSVQALSLIHISILICIIVDIGALIFSPLR